MVSLKTLLDKEKLHELTLKVGFLPVSALMTSYMNKENTSERERAVLQANLEWLGVQMGMKLKFEKVNI